MLTCIAASLDNRFKCAAPVYGCGANFTVAPAWTNNCAILGASLFMQEREYETLAEATVFGAGSGIGWFMAIAGIAAIREKMRYSNVPDPLKGLGITFILTGLMAIAFMGLMGINI